MNNYDAAKILLEMEYRERPVSESEIIYNYKKIFNLSQDEVDQILQEIQNNKPQQTTWPYVPVPAGVNYTPNYQEVGTTATVSGTFVETEPSKALCYHKWKSYLGLNESFDYCEYCDEKRYPK